MRSSWVLLFCGYALSLSPGGRTAPTEPELRLVPHICVITSQKPQCTIRLNIEVSGVAQAQLLCLHSPQEQLSCQLHQPGQISRFEVPITTSENLPLQLKTADGRLLASSMLQLVQYQEVHKRHQRAYLWNML